MISKVNSGATPSEATVWMAQNQHPHMSKQFLSGHQAAEVLRDWARKNGRHGGWCHIASKDDGSTVIVMPGALALTGCPITFTELTKAQAIEQGYLPADETPPSE